MDKTAWAFSFALLIVGSFGVRAAFRTLKAIEKQADPMVQQITVARDAANAAKENIVLLIRVGADCLDARRWLRGWLLIGLAVLLDGLASASGMIGCLPWDWGRCLHDGEQHSQRDIFHGGNTVTRKYLTSYHLCNTVMVTGD